MIPIQDIDENVRHVFEAHAHPITQNLTRENLHARIRGLLMMAESNDTGALLISCGNETEIALGYATLYGDMCGGISLIGDLSKMDVYRLARYVNQRHGAELIPPKTLRHRPVGRARRRAVRPVRLRGGLAGRRRAGRAADERRRTRQPVRAAARSTPRASCPTPRAARSTTSTRPRPSALVDDAPAHRAAPSTSASRARRSSPSRSARSGSI